MKPILATVLFTFSMAVSAFSQSAADSSGGGGEVERRIGLIQSQFREARKQTVDRLFQEKVRQLDLGYLQAVEREFENAIKAGQLEDAVAVRKEKEMIAEGSGVPESDDPGIPAGIASLRETYRGEHRKLIADRDLRTAPLAEKLDADLAAYQILLTREGRLDDALKVKLARENPELPTTPLAASRGLAPELARATKETPFENSLGMKFVPAPGTGVLFCIHETRYRDYKAYAKNNRDINPNWENQTYAGFEIKRGGEDHPVVQVNWYDAQAFCKWLSEKEGKIYRLPTDREWSLAVGIGNLEKWDRDTTPATVFKSPDQFPWGSGWPPPPRAGNYSDASRPAKAARVEGGYDDGVPTTAPVMNFAANELGLFDLGGNVWEWCEDWCSDERKERVLRGASWTRDGHGTLLSSFRPRHRPEKRNDDFGFRVVLETGGQALATVAAIRIPSDPAPASRIEIVEALYGSQEQFSTGKAKDVTELVRAKRVGDSLEIHDKRATFGDPHPYHGKIFKLKYRFDGKSAPSGAPFEYIAQHNESINLAL